MALLLQVIILYNHKSPVFYICVYALYYNALVFKLIISKSLKY